MNASPRKNLQSRGASPPAPGEREQWLERFRRSGLSQAAFAQVHGLSLSTLRYWLYHRSALAKASASAPRWQEIRVNGWPSSVGWGAEISLPGGCIVRLQAELARELVAPLLGRS
jgi:hypothetical protein